MTPFCAARRLLCLSREEVAAFACMRLEQVIACDEGEAQPPAVVMKLLLACVDSEPVRQHFGLRLRPVAERLALPVLRGPRRAPVVVYRPRPRRRQGAH